MHIPDILRHARSSCTLHEAITDPLFVPRRWVDPLLQACRPLHRVYNCKSGLQYSVEFAVLPTEILPFTFCEPCEEPVEPDWKEGLIEHVED